MSDAPASPAKPRPWIALRPDGKYCLLVPQSGLKGWWQQVGGSFSDVAEAQKYARKEGFEAEAPPMPASQRAAPATRGTRPDRHARWRSETQEWVNGRAMTPLRKQALEILQALADPDGNINIGGRDLLEAMNHPDPHSTTGYQILDALRDMDFMVKTGARTYRLIRPEEETPSRKLKLNL